VLNSLHTKNSNSKNSDYQNSNSYSNHFQRLDETKDDLS